MTITEAFIRYDQELTVKGMSLKTRKNYRSALNSLIKACGDVPVELISFDQITRWTLFMQTDGHQPSSIKTDICKLRQVFNYLRRQGLKVIDARDIDLPKVPKKQLPWLDADEMHQLLSVIEHPRDKAIFSALWSSGSRIGALLSLNRGDINREELSAVVWDKGYQENTIYFDAHSLKLIDEYLETRRDNLSPLFLSGQFKRIGVQRIEQLLHLYTDLAGIRKNVTPQTIRRSFASDLKVNGAQLYDVSKLLNHKQISTTYSHYAFVKDDYNKENHRKYHTKSR